MVFSSYEELMAAVEERRKDLLTLEIDLGGAYSQEHEDAKQELAQAKAMKQVGIFLADDGEIDRLEQRVADTKPEAQSVFVQFEKLDLNEWRELVSSTTQMTPLAQYEKVLPKTFKGVYGVDPVQPDDWDAQHPGEEWVKPEPLTISPLSVSSQGGAASILPGGSLHSVVQSFMAWQNSGGDVTIRPTRSGRD